MKSLLSLLLLLIPNSAVIRTQAQQVLTGKSYIAITHVAIIDTDHGSIHNDMTVIIVGNQIAGLDQASNVKVPSAAQVIDAKGEFLIPGLWDMHVHIFGGDRFPTASPLLIANGVTGVREMGTCVPLATIKGIKQQITEGKLLGPRIFAAGPVVDGRFKDWTNLNVTSEVEAREAVRSLKQQGANFIKVYDNLSRPAYLAIADESRKQGIDFVGHVPYGISPREASAAGQKSIEHLVGIPAACSTDETQLQQQYDQALNERDFSRANVIGLRADIRAAETFSSGRCQELASVFRAHGTWQCPTLVNTRATYAYDVTMKKDWRLKFIPKEWKSDWMSFPEHDIWFKDLRPADRDGLVQVYRRLVESVGTLHHGGVNFLAGTDLVRPFIYPGFSLHEELELLVSAGLSPAEALQAATSNPAKFLGVEHTLGTVEKGKLADLVLLDDNPLVDIHNTQKIRAVIVNGKYLDRTALDELLADTAASANTP